MKTVPIIITKDEKARIQQANQNAIITDASLEIKHGDLAEFFLKNNVNEFVAINRIEGVFRLTYDCDNGLAIDGVPVPRPHQQMVAISAGYKNDEEKAADEMKKVLARGPETYKLVCWGYGLTSILNQLLKNAVEESPNPPIPAPQ